MSDPDDLKERISTYRGRAEEGGEESAARREVADELRTLGHALPGSAASADELRAVADELRRQAEAIREARGGATTSEPGGPVTVPGMEDFHERSPIAGHSNPLAPPAILGVDADASVVVGEVTFGPAFEGAPGIVHGGFVAALLDEALGMASALSGRACMTAELTTRYRQHTPVATLLRVEARLVSVEGRKVRTTGELYDGDEVIAEASGLFIAVDAGKFAQLADAREGKGRSSR